MCPVGAPQPGAAPPFLALMEMADVVYRGRDPAQALIKSEDLLKAYLSVSKVGLCILDANFRYVAINNTLAAINGMPAEEHLGKSIHDMLGDVADTIEPYLQRVLSTREPVLNVEISSILPTRVERGHWVTHFIPIKDDSGEVLDIGAIVIETTTQKKLEESLQGISEMLREKKKREQVMQDVSRLLTTKWDAERTFPQISAYLRRILRQEYAALAVRDEKSGNLVRLAMDFPLAKDRGAGEEISIANGSGGRALRERSALILAREDVERSDPKTCSRLVAEGIQALCCVPLVRPHGPVGVLVLGSTRSHAFQTGDLGFLNQVAAQLALTLENAQIAGEVRKLKRKLNQEKSYLEGEVPRYEAIVGESRALKKVLQQATVVAPSDATVLILGETGTGKGLIAQMIHRSSQRKDQNFVTLNCAAIPTGLLESELFGHETGAFTGAVSQKIGRLELADRGTLFLDEIGEIPLELQPKLLRVLQDHEFERLGGTRTIKVNLRLIAATNRDLTRSVAERHFRSDLFYRLNVFPIHMPSLRQRREDIPLLVRHFVRKYARRMDRVIETIPRETMQALVNWPWPGNVRELENLIERSVILTRGTGLQAPLQELQEETLKHAGSSLQQTEREHILRVLRETGGFISGQHGAARRLGLKRTTLQSKMQRLGITRAEYLPGKPNDPDPAE